MKNCKYCGNECVEQLQKGRNPKDIDYYCYGDFEHVCPVCGAVGTENFGHGISWKEGKPKEKDQFTLQYK